jgi:hypothetical protein
MDTNSKAISSSILSVLAWFACRHNPGTNYVPIRQKYGTKLGECERGYCFAAAMSSSVL